VVYLELHSQADKWFVNPRWRTIRNLGRLPIFGISAATIVLVPLLAKGIIFLQEWSDKLAKSIGQAYPQFGIWLHAFSEILTLPFVLKLLALSALFGIVGKIVYIVRCPPYLKYGDSFHEFRHAHSDALMVMRDAFLNLWNASTEEKQKKYFSDLYGSHAVEFMTDVKNSRFVPCSLTQVSQVSFRIREPTVLPAIQGHLITLMNNPIFGEAIFVLLRESMDDSRRWSRVLCASVYYVATVFAGWAILIQGMWVIRGVFS